MTADCVVCGAATPDGFACVTETERARMQLLGDPSRDDMPGIVELAPAARAVAYRQTNTGPTGSIHHAPGPTDPIDLQAGARLDAVQTALTGWVRAVREDGKIKSAPRGGDLIAASAEWLADPDQMNAIRGLEYAAEVLREIGDCWHTMRSVVATPAGRVYLGVCGAPKPFERCEATTSGRCLSMREGFTICDEGECVRAAKATCDGDVYGKPGRNAAYCQTCGAAYDQDERRLQVTRLVDGKGFRASVIAHAYGLPADTIRGWAWVRRDSQGEPLNDPKLKPVGRDERNRPLYLVADVLALNAKAEQRRQQRTAQGAGMGA